MSGAELVKRLAGVRKCVPQALLEEVAALEAVNAELRERVHLLSTLAVRALAEGWSLAAYERELVRLERRGCRVVAKSARSLARRGRV